METINNPPFKILSTEQHSHLEDFGDDDVFWWVEVKTEAYEVPVLVRFDSVITYCQQQHANIGGYYRSVRKNIKGLGPKHSKMFAIMDEEGFDQTPHIYNYIKDCIDLQKHHEHNLRLEQSLATPVDAKKLKRSMKSLEQGMPSMRASAIRNTAFTDQILDILTNEVLERYPEIFNSDPEYITECEGILINAVIDLGTKIDSLSFKAENKN